MRYLSLFTGIGGLDYGLEKLGAECVGFSEINPHSIQIYLSNYPDRQNFGDITKIKPDELPDFDILTGGFPCQSFSMIGLRRGLNDARGLMILHIRNIIVAKRPKYLVLENVKGLLTHDKGNTYYKVHQLLQSAGYKVRVVLLNSVYYGSAQSRERLFFCGRLDEDFPAVNPEIVNDQVRFGDVMEDGLADFKMVSRTDRADRAIQQELDDARANYELIGAYDRVGTLTTGDGCGKKAVPYGEWFRNLTPVECERLQGFPDGWTSGVPDSKRYYALGNAVNCHVSEYLFTKYLKEIWEYDEAEAEVTA